LNFNLRKKQAVKSLFFKPLRLEAVPNETRNQIFFDFNEKMVSKALACFWWLGQLRGRRKSQQLHLKQGVFPQSLKVWSATLITPGFA